MNKFKVGDWVEIDPKYREELFQNNGLEPGPYLVVQAEYDMVRIKTPESPTYPYHSFFGYRFRRVQTTSTPEEWEKIIG